MPTCYRCGNPIDFRVVDGQAIPFHIYGSCSSASSSWSGYGSFASSMSIAERPRLYRVPTWSDDVCYPSRCPKCGGDVFFVRHNGGSVWLDPPLGWPWPKHACMYEEGPREFATIFGPSSGSLRADAVGWGLCVVGNVAVFSRRRFSILHIHFANGSIRLVGLNGLLNDLVGEVVFLFPHFGRLYLCTTDGVKLFIAAEHV